MTIISALISFVIAGGIIFLANMIVNNIHKRKMKQLKDKHERNMKAINYLKYKVDNMSKEDIHSTVLKVQERMYKKYERSKNGKKPKHSR